MRRLPLLAAALVATAAAGCGSSSSSNSNSGPATGSTLSSAAQGAGTLVKLQNIQFNPKTVKVKVGQQVQWQNFDNVDHNVTSTSGASFKSDNFAHGGSFSFTPAKAGTINYTCTLHPGMDGEIDVTG
jgi:plastocyanin